MCGSELRMRFVCVMSAVLLGCGPPVCATLRPTLEADDIPIDVPGLAMHVVTARPDQRWVVFTQVMQDTDGGGRVEMFVVRGVGPRERIDAFLGATEDAVGIIRDGAFELVDVHTGARRSADAPSLTLRGYANQEHGIPADARLTRDGLLVWPTRDRHGVELLNTHDWTRRTIPARGWVHSIQLDESSAWLVIESIAQSPTDMDALTQRPRLPFDPYACNAPEGFCRGFTTCEGPERTFEVLNLRSTSDLLLTVESARDVTLRAWGLVSRGEDGGQLLALDGTSYPLPPCPIAYVGVESPIVITHCEERNQTANASLWVNPIGSTEPHRFEGDAVTTLAEIDRVLLARLDVQEGLLTGDVNVRGERALVSLRLGPTTYLRWDAQAHAWSEPPRRLLSDAIAVSPDGSALVMRRPLDVHACYESHPVQLVWVQLNDRWRHELPVFDDRNRDDVWQ